MSSHRLEQIVPALAIVALAGMGASTRLWAAAGRTSGTFLQEPFGARPFAMGHAYAALGDDIFGMTYNPASLSRLNQSEIAAQFTQGVFAAQMGFLGLASPLNPSNALGLSAAYLNTGTAEIFDASGNQTASVIGERDFLLSFGYAHSFSFGDGESRRNRRSDSLTMDAGAASMNAAMTSQGRLNIGAAAKLLNSALAEQERATAYAADIGAIYETPWRGGLISAGLTGSNLGRGISYSGGLASGSASDPLPMTTRLALGYSKDVFSADAFAIGIETDRVYYDNQMFEALGAEYNYHGICALRFGYRLGQDGGGLSFGFGLKFKDLRVDYGFGLMQAIGNVQQASLNYRFSIPGIRYSASTPPSPLETLIGNARNAISGERFFDAGSEIERIDTFFPDASEARQLQLAIQAELNEILSRGPGAPRYSYALGYQRYTEKNWPEAAFALEGALRADPNNLEIGKYLEKARRNLGEQRRQLKLQSQARTATLFELASQSYQEKDLSRALRLVDEILRLGSYQPADELKRRIKDAQRRPGKSLEQPHPAPPAAPASTGTIIARPRPSPEDIARSEKLYWEGVRNYSDNLIDQALKNLREAKRMNPDSATIQAALDNIEKALRERTP